jgi:alpha-mannosidase
MCVAALLALPVAPVQAEDVATKKMYTVGVSHLDTQWFFTIQETIRDLIPHTFLGTFELFRQFPDFHFSWEGAFRYMLLEEYYPEIYAELLEWVDQGRWAPGGSSLEASDVNVPSVESLIRNFMIGSRYFRDRLGKTSVDVFLPDCFGFGYALPTAAVHCGLTGFSTQKLYWQSAVDIPFGIGVWKGVDGSELISVLQPRGYTDPVDHDLSHDQGMLDYCSATFPDDDLQVGFTYYGVGDKGGPVRTADAQWVQHSILSDGPIQVTSSFSDQIFRDLTPSQVAQLPRYDGELLLTTHGTGSYTSQSALKRWNRNSELLADAAERASVLADWHGVQPYPAKALYDAWVRFLIQHFHDILPGTSTADVYPFAWNDILIALNRLGSLLTDSLGALSQLLDTEVQGIPLVVFNPLAMNRSDLVQAVVRFPHAAPEFIAVFDPEGTEALSQILNRGDDWLDILFLAHLDSVGLAVYDVRVASGPCTLPTGLTATSNQLENDHYKVTLDAAGDIAGIEDKTLNRPLLTAPIRLGLWDNQSTIWPAWEVLWSDLSQPALEHVGGTPEIHVVETGPARVALEVRRTHGSSTYVQRISLGAGASGDRVEVENHIDWHSPSRTLKAVFPLASGNPVATYDLGVGVIQRPNSTERMYEVPAQQWADLSVPGGAFGVTVSSDCKYGWDKPDDGTLRLTLLNTPLDWEFAVVRYAQHTQDLGPHVMTFAIQGHAGDWTEASWPVAARLNQKLLAFQTARGPGDGGLGRRYAPVQVSGGDVALTALKQAEDGDGYVVRLIEKQGRDQEGVSLTFGQGIESAEELSGIEDPMGPAERKDGALFMTFRPFQIRSFRIRPKASPVGHSPVTSRVVPLEYNVDVISRNDARGDGIKGLDEYNKPVSIPGELVPATITDGTVVFSLGSSAAGDLNAVECRGQAVALPETQERDRLFVLAAAQKDRTCTFQVGGQDHQMSVPNFTGFIGSWVGRVINDEIVYDPSLFLPPFYKQQRIGWYTTHRHKVSGDDPYKFTYLFRFELPVPAGATEVILPDDPTCRVFAMSLSSSAATRIAAASRLFAEFDPLAHPLDWSVMNPAADPEDPVEPSPEPAEDVQSQPDGMDGEIQTDPAPVPGKKGGGCNAAPVNGSGLSAILLVLAVLVCLAVARARRKHSHIIADAGP